jgi:hypothetical protein
MCIDEWAETPRQNASDYAGTALADIHRELPSDVWQRMQAADDVPMRPRERTPVFYGSFDGHSCVEMHWSAGALAAHGALPDSFG